MRPEALALRRVGVLAFPVTTCVPGNTHHISVQAFRTFQPLALFFEDVDPMAELIDFTSGRTSLMAGPIPLSVHGKKPNLIDDCATGVELLARLLAAPNRGCECSAGSPLTVVIRNQPLVRGVCYGIEWAGNAPAPLRVEVEEIGLKVFAGRVTRETLLGSSVIFSCHNVTREAAERMTGAFVERSPQQWF